jgi:hypothetical protein
MRTDWIFGEYCIANKLPKTSLYLEVLQKWKKKRENGADANAV